MLTLERLQEVLEYDPDTGYFMWLVKCSNRTGIGDYAGAIDSSLRRKIQIDGKQYYASRLAFFYMTGEWPSNLIDHKDGDTLNDVWSNLREATFSESTHNRLLPVGESGLRGVRRIPSDPPRWEARIAVGHNRQSLGTYDTAEEAHAAYLAASENLHGEYAPHNRQKGAT